MSIELSNEGELTPEADLAVKLGTSLDALRRAREQYLTEGVHWVHQGRMICITAAGIALLLGTDLPPEKKEGGAPRILVVVASTGDPARKRRVLRGRVKESGAVCFVFLTGTRSLASQFRRGQELECTRREGTTDGFEYDGKAPKRLPI